MFQSIKPKVSSNTYFIYSLRLIYKLIDIYLLFVNFLLHLDKGFILWVVIGVY